MILGLPPNFQDAQGLLGIQGSFGNHVQEVGLADVVGTAAGHQNSSWAEHLQGTQVEFFVAAQGGIQVLFGFREGGRVENNGVELTAGGGVVLKQIESVGFEPFDFVSIEGGILIGNFEGGARAV